MFDSRRYIHPPKVKSWLDTLLALGDPQQLARDRERSVRTAWIMGIFSVIPDIIATIMSGSVAMLTDVFRTGTDTLASFLSWWTLRKMAHGKTREYNYGYGKMENLASLAVAAAMTLSFLIVIISAVERFHRPEPMKNITFGVVFISIAGLVNAWCWMRNRRLARRERSAIMESQWRLFRAKTIINGCILAALISGKLLNEYHWSVYIDPITSLLLASFLLFSSYQIISMSVYDLLDRSIEESLKKDIYRDLEAYLGCQASLQGIRSRRSGSHIYIEIFLHFNKDCLMGDVQRIIEEITTSLERKIIGSQVVVGYAADPVFERPPLTAPHPTLPEAALRR